MKYCPNPECDYLVRFGRISEYLDESERCSDCGAALAVGEAPRVEPPAFRELVTVYKAANGVQAHLVKGVLEGEDIPVFISGEALMGAMGELPVTMLDVEVQVPPQFAERARELALEWDTERPNDEQPNGD